MTSKDLLWWTGTMAPHEYGRTYTVKLRYKRDGVPRVWVKTPDLKALAGDQRLPHVYDHEAQELCLYLPGCGFWKAEMLIASSILEWTRLWFYYFEIWLVTGEWHGHGEHPR